MLCISNFLCGCRLTNALQQAKDLKKNEQAWAKSTGAIVKEVEDKYLGIEEQAKNELLELENKERGLKGISVKDILTYTIDLKQTQSLLFTYNKNDSIEYNKVLSLRNKAKESVMIDTIIEDMIKRESLIFECK